MRPCVRGMRPCVRACARGLGCNTVLPSVITSPPLRRERESRSSVRGREGVSSRGGLLALCAQVKRGTRLQRFAQNKALHCKGVVALIQASSTKLKLTPSDRVLAPPPSSKQATPSKRTLHPPRLPPASISTAPRAPRSLLPVPVPLPLPLPLGPTLPRTALLILRLNHLLALPLAALPPRRRAHARCRRPSPSPSPRPRPSPRLSRRGPHGGGLVGLVGARTTQWTLRGRGVLRDEEREDVCGLCVCVGGGFVFGRGRASVVSVHAGQERARGEGGGERVRTHH